MSSCPKENYQLNLEIAGVSLEINTFCPWKEEEEFVPFIKKTEYPDYRIVFCETEVLPTISKDILHEDHCYWVHPDEKGGYQKSFFDGVRDFSAYAVARYDHAEGNIRIDCLPEGARWVSELHNSFFCIDFESLLIHKDRLCLHASCVDTPWGGLLFSGPSGIGKSTQAELWCRHRRAKQINGDRPILSKGKDGWLAWGSPYAGSSKCHLNESCPVTAIVMLQQAKECSLQRLDKKEAFRSVWSGMTIHSWDREFVEKAFELTKGLIETVPVFKFSCTPDENAVNYLEDELRKECCL